MYWYFGIFCSFTNKMFNSYLYKLRKQEIIFLLQPLDSNNKNTFLNLLAGEIKMLISGSIS